jgi:hypothetical protein
MRHEYRLVSASFAPAVGYSRFKNKDRNIFKQPSLPANRVYVLTAIRVSITCRLQHKKYENPSIHKKSSPQAAP